MVFSNLTNLKRFEDFCVIFLPEMLQAKPDGLSLTVLRKDNDNHSGKLTYFGVLTKFHNSLSSQHFLGYPLKIEMPKTNLFPA
jgi:hypothetical protein